MASMRSPDVHPQVPAALTAEAYLKHWMLPNMYCHVTTAYAMLRHNGVELGKADYLVGGTAG